MYEGSTALVPIYYHSDYPLTRPLLDADEDFLFLFPGSKREMSRWTGSGYRVGSKIADKTSSPTLPIVSGQAFSGGGGAFYCLREVATKMKDDRNTKAFRRIYLIV